MFPVQFVGGGHGDPGGGPPLSGGGGSWLMSISVKMSKKLLGCIAGTFCVPIGG